MAFNRTYYFNFISDQDLTYRVELFDDVATAAFQNKEGTLGAGAVELSYGSTGAEMFAEFKPSTMTLEYMVTDTNSAGYINQLRTNRKERQVYGYLYRETVLGTATPTTSPVWGGFLLLDLSQDPDISKPFPITLKFIDGLASLKYYDFVPSTTTQSADHLYDRGDTFISDVNNSGGQFDVWRTFIDLISLCMGYTGHYTTATGATTNPVITTAARWYNGLHANVTVDPLVTTRMKPDIYYEKKVLAEQDWPLEDIVKYKARNCYDILESLCKGWGMRLYLWKNTWYFIQINEYRNTQSGTYAAPDDVSSHNYSMAGVTSGASDSISTEWGTYYLYLNSLGGGITRNYKIAGGQYGILPALKKVTIKFMALDNVNRFTFFPPISPAAAPTGTMPQDHFSWSSLGTFSFDGTNDQDFYQRIILNFTNNSVYDADIYMFFGLFARVAGTGSNVTDASPESNGWTHMYFSNTPGSTPAGVWLGQSNWPQDATFMSQSVGTPYVYPSYQLSINIPPGLTTVNVLEYPGSFGTNWWQYMSFPHCPASVFTVGEWEFAYYTKSNYYHYPGTTLNQSYESHGMIYSPGQPLGSDSYAYGIQYTNPTVSQTGLYSSQFAPVVDGSVGMESITNELVQVGTDTVVEEMGETMFGDTGIISSEGTLQVYDGSDWEVTDIAGEWGIDVLTGDNSFTQQLAHDVLATQAKSTKTFDVSSTTNPAESIYDNDGTATSPRFANPGTKWQTLQHYGTGTPATTWIMHTGTWHPKADTWNWKLYEQAFYAATTTSSTSGNTGTNSGVYGGPNVAVPAGGGIGAMVGPPTGQNLGAISNLLNKGQFTQVKPIAIVSANQSITASGATSLAQTITSLTVQEMPVAILKSGDTIVLQTQSRGTQTLGSPPPLQDTLGTYNPITFVLDADQAAGATSLSVTSKVINRPIYVGDIISFDTQDLIAQYQNKTKGSIAGMRVTDTTFDSAASVGRNIMSFRVEGDDLDDGTYYVFNGEDQTRSNRFQPDNTSAPTSIGTQRSFKSMCFIADGTYNIESGKAVASGTSGWSIAIQLYKATPVDGSTSTQAMTLLGTYTIALGGNSKTKTANLVAGTTAAIAEGDMIIPHVYAAASGGTTYDFRGGITFTLVRTSAPS